MSNLTLIKKTDGGLTNLLCPVCQATIVIYAGENYPPRYWRELGKDYNVYHKCPRAVQRSAGPEPEYSVLDMPRVREERR